MSQTSETIFEGSVYHIRIDGRNCYTEIFRTPAAFFLQLLELRHQHEPSEKNPIPKSNLLSEFIDKIR